MDMDTNMIMEIITIYRKMKKGRENQNIYRMLLNVGAGHNNEEAEELIQTTPTIYDTIKNNSVYDFCRFRSLKDTKYIYFSQEKSLIQSNILFQVSDFKNLIEQKFYWINIFNPNEKDLEILANVFDVHDISLIDIREKNTEEKIEVFNHYIFISLKLFSDSNWKETEDIDFNILMFKNFIITTHDKPWGGINDILNFLSLIGMHTSISPDWVLYSVIIEFLQDSKYVLDNLRPEINSIRDVGFAHEGNVEDILRSNFTLAYQIYALRNTIKPKVSILSTMKLKCTKRMRKDVLKHLSDCYNDFKKQEKEVKEFNKILERLQDLCLAIVNMLQSKESNAMNKSMKWFTKITFIFLPCQTVAGLWGMNVKVPGRDTESFLWFFALTFIGPLITIFYFYLTSARKKRIRKKTIEEQI